MTVKMLENWSALMLAAAGAAVAVSFILTGLLQELSLIVRGSSSALNRRADMRRPNRRNGR